MANSLIGQEVPRSDACGKVTGRASYIGDFELPGMLYARILRSPVPHARIARLDVAAASALPGVTVLTAADFERWGLNPCYGPVLADQPVVAVGKVRYVGDPVAAVAAADEALAEAALARITVEYEELPAVYDPRAALAADAPILHDAPASASPAFADLQHAHGPAHPNVCGEFRLRRGDVAQGLASAAVVVAGEFYSPTAQHQPLEPQGSVARVSPDGRIEVWSNTQTPSVVRSQLASQYQVPVSRVRVVVPYVGGGYGSKAYAKLEPLAVALARKAGRPVRVYLSSQEQFLTIVRHAAVARLRLGFTADGTLLAADGEMLMDTGAYADIGPRTCKFAGYSLPGPYYVPNVQVDAYAVYTNKTPSGAYRGYGVPQGCWAYDQLMDEAAHRLGIDPLTLRLRNVPQEGYVLSTGDAPSSRGLREALERVAAAVDWGKPRVSEGGSTLARGKGISCSNKSTITPSLSQGVVTMSEDGSVSVLTSTVEIGQGAETVLKQIVASELGVPLDWVTVIAPDTDVTPYDQATTASRSTVTMGNALSLAARDLKAQLLQVAAQLLEASPDDLAVDEGRVFVQGAPARTATFAEVLRHRFGASLGTLVGRGEHQTSGGLDPETGQGKASSFWFPSAAAVEIEIDRETGELRILRLVTATDVGKAIHPRMCHQQNEGSVLMGLGLALSEELVYEDGQPRNAHLADYKVPSIKDFPSGFQSILLENPDPESTFGARGVGEAAVPPILGALGNAVYDAIGVRLTELPITAEKIRQALREREATEHRA